MGLGAPQPDIVLQSQFRKNGNTLRFLCFVPATKYLSGIRATVVDNRSVEGNGWTLLQSIFSPTIEKILQRCHKFAPKSMVSSSDGRYGNVVTNS